MDRKSFAFTWLLLVGLLLALLLKVSQPEPAVAGPPGTEEPEMRGLGETLAQDTLFAAAGHNGQPGYELGASGQASVYLPIAARGAQDNVNTTFFVQNTGASMATITVTFYYSTGLVAHTFHDTLPAFGSSSYEQVTTGDLRYGFEGSAVVTADQPILVTANVERASGTVTLDLISRSSFLL